ncbi:hypothetical protein ACO22_07087 [Paracoccidioides brasiliensis]|uniref:Uncharacterized protein n=1 Tax=Paracoccidioides brasiliensis TaxID=121759 RepID=A0A1D2J5L0_PARBR|nr:hypothetical protein ACO22_07087 [Paracoccidioides brasiliensis]
MVVDSGGDGDGGGDDYSGIDLTFDEIIDADIIPTQCPGTQCLCLGDDQLPLSGRINSFLFTSRSISEDNIQNSHFSIPTLLCGCTHPT